MVDLVAWDRGVKELFKNIEEDIGSKRRRVAKRVFEFLVDTSPVFSGYYASNHSIQVGGLRSGRDFPRSPKMRAKWAKRGQYVNLIHENADRQLAKLAQDKGPYRSVTIGTSVPYAEFINAAQQYALAAAQIELEFENQ